MNEVWVIWIRVPAFARSMCSRPLVVTNGIIRADELGCVRVGSFDLVMGQ